MTRKKTILLLVLAIFFFTSCKNNSIEDQEEPDYSYFQSSNNVDNYLDDEELSEEGDNGKTSENLSKKEWPYELDFDGITSTKTYKTGNLNSNNKNLTFNSALICPDYENNLTYYVNYGNDNYIYQLDDGVSTLLVDKEAHSLQLWDSELYFIEDTDSSPMHSGDIYCLNLESKELRLIQKANAFGLYIDSYGFYYNNFINDEGTSISLFLDFNDSEPKGIDYNFLASYNEYQILYTYEEDFYLFNSETKEKTFLAPFEYATNRPMLSNEYFMFLKDSCIYTLNLLNGEKKIYDLYNYDSLSKYSMVIKDYCAIDNLIYANDGIRLFIINVDNGNIEEYTGEYTIDYSISGSDKTTSVFSMRDLYTDGDKIYGLIYKYDDETEELVELVIEENEDTDTERKSNYPYIVKKKEIN